MVMKSIVMKTERKIKPKIAASLLLSALLVFVSSAPAALVITGTTTNNGGTAIPDWPVASDSLIAGMLPSSVGAGGFAQDYGGGTYGTIAGLPALTDGVLAHMGAGASAYGGQYATCGYNNGSGAYVIYTLPAAANGYNITNITTYTTWGDNAICQQEYAVSYSTVDNPTSFILLTFVNYAPAGSGGMANQVALTDSLGGAIAANVAAIKFDFTWPLSSYGVNAYDEITVEGTPAATLTPQPVVITTSNINDASPFDPSTTWTVETPSLIAGMAPSSLTGNPALGNGAGGGGTAVLTDGALGTTGDSTTTASLGSGGGACSSLTYTLTNSANGSDLTNIVTYSAWGDYGRDGQYYNVSYSTVMAPTTFIPLTSVAFNPYLNPLGTPSANRVGISSLTGVLAKNVYSVKFDFPQDNTIDYGSGSYQEIILQGTNSLPSAVPPSAYLLQDTLPNYAETVVGDQVVFTAAFSNYPPATLQWQFINTNNTATNNIAGATNATLTLTNVQVASSGSYRLEALNATNSLAAPSFSSAAPLVVGSTPTAVDNIIVDYAGQCGLGGESSLTNFVPSWAIDTNNDLILGYQNSSGPGTFTPGTGDFGESQANSDPTILSDGEAGYFTYWPSVSANQALCTGGVSPAGETMTYTLNLASAPYGYDLTNIEVYGGWGDDSRNEQKYQVLYSTVAAPTVFNALTTVDYNPGDPKNTQSATRTILVPASGALVQNVAAVEINFDLVGAPPKNDYEGYSEILIKGKASANIPSLTQDITPLTAADVVGSSLILNAAFSGATSYQWQKNGTNISGAISPTLTLSNLQLTDTATNGGYRLVAYNSSGSAATRGCSVIVNQTPATVGNVVTTFAYQTSDQVGFAPTWSTAELTNSLIYQQDPPAGGYDPNGNFNDPDSNADSHNQAGGLPVLTDGNYGYFENTGPHPAFATCGPNAGEYVVYTLGTNANGYNLTNIQIAGGWNDSGRDSQWYTLSYSTVANPATFIPIAVVANEPTVTDESVIRATFTAASGLLASNAYAIYVDFTTPSGDPNGYSGYSEISVFGSPTTTPSSQPVVTCAFENLSTPDWVVPSPNLIGGQLPSSYDTNANDSFSANDNGGLTELTDGMLGASHGSGASCGGAGQGGGTFITYSPTNGSWTLTNIVVYTGWPDFGRAGQFYNLSYATVAAPATFIPLTSITYAPNVNNGEPWDTSVTIAPPVGQTVLATNVAAVHFDFTPQGSLDYGFSSYTEIVFLGTAVAPLVPPSGLQLVVSGNHLILTGVNGTPDRSYAWLTATNLLTPLTNWTVSATGDLDGTGACSNSIPIDPLQPAAYFRLQMQ